MEDEREEEVSTLVSIYPELITDLTDPFKFTLDLPINPNHPVRIHSPPWNSASEAKNDLAHSMRPPSLTTVKHFPPIALLVSLPDTYPLEQPPIVHLRTSPPWLDQKKLTELERECSQLWEEYGGCQILFTYIDFLQQAAERFFDLGSELLVDSALLSALVDFDRGQGKEIFERGNYDCGVCLEPKNGRLCHRVHSCGHIFCRPCLLDFYNSAITEGDITTITCLEPSCGQGQEKSDRNHKRKTLHPRELLEIGITEAQARRFVELKQKKKLESDKSTVYCPRTWCQGSARSKKYPPIPADLLEYIDPDDDTGDPDALPAYSRDTPDNQLPPPADRLAVCGKCTLAFCRVCYCGWHGEFARCWPRNPGELTEEEKASYDYIRLHTSPCPTCSSPTQKTMGCNHMKCFQCNTHFCYLCGAWLEPSNPYQHFNSGKNDCYMKLWELEEGDEGQGAGFGGARMWEAEARAVADAADQQEADAAVQALQAQELQHVEAQPAPPVQPVQIAVQEEVQPPHPQGRLRGRRFHPRQFPPPPPGPIDDMHAMILQIEEVRLAEEEAGQGPWLPQPERPVGGARRARGRGRGNHNQAQNAAQARGAAPQAQQGAARHAPNGQGAARGRGGGRGRGQLDNRPQDRQEEALRRFVEMAGRDQEDEWDSDELEDDDLFEIRGR